MKENVGEGIGREIERGRGRRVSSDFCNLAQNAQQRR